MFFSNTIILEILQNTPFLCIYYRTRVQIPTINRKGQAQWPISKPSARGLGGVMCLSVTCWAPTVINMARCRKTWDPVSKIRGGITKEVKWCPSLDSPYRLHKFILPHLTFNKNNSSSKAIYMGSLQYKLQYEWKYGQDKFLRLLTPSLEWKVDFYAHVHMKKKIHTAELSMPLLQKSSYWKLY